MLKIISKNKAQAIKGYMEYIKEEINDIDVEEYKVEEAQRCKLVNKKANISLQELIRRITKEENIEIEELTSKTRKQRIANIRKIIIKLSEKLCETSNRELAKTLNIDETLVLKIKSDESRMNDETRDMLKKYLDLSSCHA